MQLSRHLRPGHVLIAPAVEGRDQLFAAFGTRFEELQLVPSGHAVTRSLMEREAVLSTGIGNGWAIPHAQIPGIGHLLMVASVHPKGIDYPSIDGRPVRLAFCLLGDSMTSADHLAGLARLARLARRENALERMVAAPSPEGFIETLREIEGS